MSRLRLRSVARVALAVGAGMLGLALVAVALTARFAVLPGERLTPSGLQRNVAVHVPMRDGTRIAVDVWLPADLAAGDRVPVVMQMTRYWRARAVGPLQRAAIGLHLYEPRDQPAGIVGAFTNAGYAVVRVDARGTGASSGHRETEFSPAEIADYGAVAEWITQQPWAAPRIGATGISYEGNTAELLASTRHPAVRAVAPLYADFDPQYGLIQPGGAPMAYLDDWGAFVARLDRNAVCELAGRTGVGCWLVRLWSDGVKPVDADVRGDLRRAAVAAHRDNAPVAETFRRVEYRDDPVTSSGLGMQDTTPYGRREAIEASGVPMFVWTGWLDAATTDGALSRYLTFRNPQSLVIGAFSHGGRHDADPLAPVNKAASPARDEQFAEVVRFFDVHLRQSSATPPLRRIRYYTQGEGRWHETDVWPPPGLETRTLYFDRSFQLSPDPPRVMAAADRYTVDFDVSTGPGNRWLTNNGGGDVVYPDRRVQDKRLLSYTSAPLAADLEVTGTPVVTLHVASTAADSVFHVYLEAVRPDGEVRYLTEGVLRALHRRVAEADALPYEPIGPPRSFRRRDAAPMVPGEVAEVVLPLSATSVLVPKGWRLRIAMGGADAPLFARLPRDTNPVWSVHRAADRASRLSFTGRFRPPSEG